MKKISQKLLCSNSILIGNAAAPYRWYLFGYRTDGAVVIFTFSAPSWLARRMLKLTLGSDWFEVRDPAFEVIEPTGRNYSAAILEFKPKPEDVH